MDPIEQMMYELYIAEQDFQNKIAILREQISKTDYVAESTKYHYLEEGVKDTVIGYINKVLASIQKAWNTFKTTIADKGGNLLYDKNKKYFETKYAMHPAAGFPLPDLKKFNTFVNNTKVPTYSDAMKPYLDSVESFKKQYLSAYSDDKKSIAAIAKGNIITEATGNEVIGPNEMKEFTTFVTTDYKKSMDNIANDIKTINTSSKTIENAVKVSTVEEMFAMIDRGYLYFSEAEEDEKSTFRDANPNADTTGNTSTEDKADDKPKENISKMVGVFFKASTQLLSAKMAVSNSVFMSGIRLMNQYIKGQKKAKDATPAENKEPQRTETNNDSVDLVET